MHALLAFLILAFALCLVLTPLCRDLFLRFNIVDRPDELRKFHLKPIPRIGGIPIVLSYAGAMALMLFLAPAGVHLSVQHTTLILELLPAAAIIFITGLLDDLFTLKPWQKLSGQLLAATLAVSLGARISLSHGRAGSLWISVPLSLFWLIGCTNAVNLIDGLDGLATGVGLFATLTTLIVAIIQGNLGLAMATAPLAGCLLAFLRYNFSPASVFLGDSGSLTIGFLLGCFSLIWSQHTGTLLGMAAPLMALALPLIDVGLSIGRRMLRDKPIFQGDRGHIHHMVLARGFKPRDAALILYGVSALAAFLALLQSFTNYQFRGLILLVFCALVWTGVNYLGYVELSAARKTLTHRMVLRVLKEEIYIQELTHALAATTSIEDCWQVVRGACHDLSFASVQMLLHDESYEATFLNRLNDHSWKLTVTLGKKGHLILTRAQDSTSPRHMMLVLDHLQQNIRAREHLLLRSNPKVEAAVASGAA